MEIEIAHEDRLSVGEFLDVLHRSASAERRAEAVAATRASFSPRGALYPIAAPAAVSYYVPIGMTRHDRCFAFLPATRL